MKTELGKIEERAQTIYSDKLLENANSNFNIKVETKEVIEQLKIEGYQIEQIAVSDKVITGISLDKTSMTLALKQEQQIKVNYETEGELFNYYAVVDGKYYKIHSNKGFIIIDREPSEVEGNAGTIDTLSVQMSDETIATVTVDNTTSVVNVTAKKVGTATITVTYESNKIATCIIIVEPPKVEDIIGEVQETAVSVKDENGNQVVIPEGFRILPHGIQNDEISEVIYNYNETKHTPCVQDGIVIADAENNQFVWIPVGEIMNKDKSKTTIILGRYKFVKEQPIPAMPAQTQDNYLEAVGISRTPGVN